MHELAATKHLLDTALYYAEKAEAHSITNIYLTIGQLSTMLDDSVQFYWNMLSDGTLAAGSRLHFHRVPAQMQCEQCGCTYEIGDTDDFLCPSCRIPGRIVTGDEFLLEAIDIEK